MANYDDDVICQISPGQIGLKFVTENFTTFFAARTKKFVSCNSLWEELLFCNFSDLRKWGCLRVVVSANLLEASKTPKQLK